MDELHRDFTPISPGQQKEPAAIRRSPAKLPHYRVQLSRACNQKTNRNFYQRTIDCLLAELGVAREHERQKIANELHDRIAQSLALAKMKLALLETAVARKQVPMVRDIHKVISEVIDETRSLMCHLYPVGTGDLGLRAMLEWLVQLTQANYGIPCVAEIMPVPPLPPEVEDTIVQAARELLVNAAKHAQATEAKVVARADQQRLIIEIIDDGIGFKPMLPSALDRCRGSFGLLSIRERLFRAGGSMQIDSAPGRGTKVTMMFPINTRKGAYDELPRSHQ